MEDFRFPPFQGPGCLVARVDYGFAGPYSGGCRVVDLQREPLPDLGAPSFHPGLAIRHADLLMGWARTRRGAGLWRDLHELAHRSGLILECRFPRNARSLVAGLGALGRDLRSVETPTDGRVPPLYQRIRHHPELLHLHLMHEWWTGMGVARGGTALLRIAFALADRGPCSAPCLASVLGVSAGATRSYLRWMGEAALLRRDGSHFDLRHPLLRSLFGSRSAPLEPQPAPAHAPSKGWNHLELD